MKFLIRLFKVIPVPDKTREMPVTTELVRKQEAGNCLSIVLKQITADISHQVKEKKIYIPGNIHYALPASEKQFTGNFPSGTYVELPGNMITGVHWKDVDDQNIDLDLSLISPEKGKLGWDGDYRNEERSILFSGDITEAPLPDRATELFYISSNKDAAYIMLVNYYNNYNPLLAVPFKIVVAGEKAASFGANYMINPNNVIAKVNSRIVRSQKILGLLVITNEWNRFYFSETNLGCSIISKLAPYIPHSKEYLYCFYTNTITLNDLLWQAGAVKAATKEQCEIDLSPGNLGKDTLLNLLAP